MRRALADLTRPVLGTSLLIILFELAARVWPLPDLAPLWLVLLSAASVAGIALLLRHPPEALVLHAAGELAGDTALFESLGRKHGGSWDALVDEAARKRSEGACREGSAAPLAQRLMPLAALLAAVLVLLPDRAEPAHAEPALLASARAEFAATARRTHTAAIPDPTGNTEVAELNALYTAALQSEIDALQRLTGTEDLAAAALSAEALAASILLDGFSPQEQAELALLLARLPDVDSATSLGEKLAELESARTSGNGAAAARALGALARRLSAMAPVASALRRLEFVSDAAGAGGNGSARRGTGTVPVLRTHVDAGSARTRSPSAEALLDRYFRGPR